MSEEDIRWKQRLQSFSSALLQLTEAVELYQTRPLSNIEKQGMVKAFEFSHELAWKLMKDFFQNQGNTRIMGSRDATREAFQLNLIEKGEEWMDMIKARNQAVHTYDESMAIAVMEKTADIYHALFLEFEKKMLDLANEA